MQIVTVEKTTESTEDTESLLRPPNSLCSGMTISNELARTPYELTPPEFVSVRFSSVFFSSSFMNRSSWLTLWFKMSYKLTKINS